VILNAQSVVRLDMVSLKVYVTVVVFIFTQKLEPLLRPAVGLVTGFGTAIAFPSLSLADTVPQLTLLQFVVLTFTATLLGQEVTVGGGIPICKARRWQFASVNTRPYMGSVIIVIYICK